MPATETLLNDFVGALLVISGLMMAAAVPTMLYNFDRHDSLQAFGYFFLLIGGGASMSVGFWLLGV